MYRRSAASRKEMTGMGFLAKFRAALSKTKKAIFGSIDALLKLFVRVDEDLLDELEELLITADVGVATTEEILDR
ncbi:MAG: signal recognition particle receptor subunit alpha, partial [Clostridia bacterium]|nr:signal recognition particle receptor subunit alpha [Clostridia bacterium]